MIHTKKWDLVMHNQYNIPLTGDVCIFVIPELLQQSYLYLMEPPPVIALRVDPSFFKRIHFGCSSPILGTIVFGHRPNPKDFFLECIFSI